MATLHFWPQAREQGKAARARRMSPARRGGGCRRRFEPLEGRLLLTVAPWDGAQDQAGADESGAISAAAVAPPASGDDAAPDGRPPWQNPVEPADVNDDGAVGLHDLLAVIQHVRRHGNAHVLPNPPTPGFAPPYVDVDGDGRAGVADVLAVVKALRVRLLGGEGEAADAPVLALAARDRAFASYIGAAAEKPHREDGAWQGEQEFAALSLQSLAGADGPRRLLNEAGEPDESGKFDALLSEIAADAAAADPTSLEAASSR